MLLKNNYILYRYCKHNPIFIGAYEYILSVSPKDYEPQGHV